MDAIEIKQSIEYQMGYSDGYKEGLNKTLEYFKDQIQIINKPTQIIISAEELLFQICSNKCFCYKTKYCKPDGLVPFDVATCKNYHTEESFSFLKNK